MVMLAACLALGVYLFVPHRLLAPRRALRFLVYTEPASSAPPAADAPPAQPAGDPDSSADDQANIRATNALLPFFLSPAPSVTAPE